VEPHKEIGVLIRSKGAFMPVMSLDSRTNASSGRYRPPAPEPRSTRLGPLRLLSALKRNPLECWTREHFENDLVVGGLPIGHVVVVNEPKAIRRVLLDNATNYQKDNLQRRILSVGLGEGLLSAEGERWRVQRRALAPVFAHRTVCGFAPAMITAAEALTEKWRCFSGQTIDVAAEMSGLTLDVLARTIFSDGFGHNAERFRAAMRTYFDAIGKISPLDVLGVPDFVPRLARLRVHSILRFFEAAIDQIIAIRRERMDADADRAPVDVLALLLKALDPETGQRLSEVEVRSNILTFIAAGHETTANALAWSLFLLSQSPEWRCRVQNEAERELGTGNPDCAERLVTTRAVVEEAIRLYPPIAAISRVAIAADELGNEKLRRGSMVVVAPYVLHRHRRLWSQPDVFDPSRFMGGARSQIDRFSYLPFGVGPRTCIGSAFALQEATLLLAIISKNFVCELVPGHQVRPVLRVTLRPGGGLPMVIRQRHCSGAASD
jgi:cytochrome P450